MVAAPILQVTLNKDLLGAPVIVRIALLLALLSATWSLAPSASATTPGTGTLCRITAHRGNTGVAQTTATENGLTGFHRAVAAGADYLETDVSATADNYPMLMHDPPVDRTTDGTGTLRSKTAAEVRALHLRDGSRVPYVSQLLAYAQQTHHTVLLELKAPGGPVWWSRVVNAIRNHGVQRVIVQSFQSTRLDKMHRLLPTVRLALTTAHRVPVSKARRYGTLMLKYTALTAHYAAALGGVAVHPWTENSAHAAWSRDMGHVDSVLTNRVTAAVAYRATHPACGQASG
jgi:glycerophosphoryl diester phosphodiesterase